MKTTPQANDLLFLNGGGEIAEIIIARNWDASSLGDIKFWPTSLCTALGIILHSNIPMFLFWGNELTCFYNDALKQCWDITGKQHSIGKNGKEIWPELWNTVGGSVIEVLNNGGPVSIEDCPAPFGRNGKSEKICSSYSCSAAYDDRGNINGVLVIYMESWRANPQRYEKEIKPMKTAGRTAILAQETFQAELEKQVKKRIRKIVAKNEELKKSEQRYHLMVEEVQDYAILYIDREGFVQNWNRGAEKIKGYKTEEIIGKNFSSFYTKKDREDGLPQKLLNLAIENNRAVQQGWRVRKDNSLFWASVVITAVHNEDNDVIGFSKVTHDLTAKKKSEDAIRNKKIELEEKNIELEKMNKELQSFAYISSHDLQEPLRKIQSFASRIAEKERNNLSEKGKYLFKRMQLSAERMQTLIDDLLAYSRTHNTEGGFKVTDLINLIEQVKQDLSDELIQKDVTIQLPNSVEISIIPFQFRQLFYNLFSNSLKFSHPEKSVHIQIENELVKGADLRNLELEENKTYCHITYSDNGIGFDKKYSAKIFELFQRLHRSTEYPGTGIGLAIIKRIIENHKGAITASSQLGQGATFDIYIPTENK